MDELREVGIVNYLWGILFKNSVSIFSLLSLFKIRLVRPPCCLCVYASPIFSLSMRSVSYPRKVGD
jgi:hypothetical protein